MDISTINSIAIMISDLGRGALYVVVTLMCFGFGRLARSRSSEHMIADELLRLSWYLSVFWVLGILLNLGLKHQICAPRPWWIDTSLVPINPRPARGFGMPSGHTQSAVGVALACSGVAMILKRHARARWWGGLASRASICLIGLGWVLAIAWSRIHLNAHSLAQVSAGGLLGVAWAAGVVYAGRDRRGVMILLLFGILCSGMSIWASLSPLELPEVWRSVILGRGVTPPSAPDLVKVLGLITLALCLCALPLRRSSRLSTRHSSAPELNV